MAERLRKALERAVEWLLDRMPKAPVPVPVNRGPASRMPRNPR